MIEWGDQEHTEKSITKIFIEKLGLSYDHINTQQLSSLGMDSLDVIEITMAIEDYYGMELDDGQLIRHGSTITDLARYIRSIALHQTNPVTPTTFDAYWNECKEHKALVASGSPGVMDMAMREIAENAWNACARRNGVVNASN